MEYLSDCELCTRHSDLTHQLLLTLNCLLREGSGGGGGGGGGGIGGRRAEGGGIEGRGGRVAEGG